MLSIRWQFYVGMYSVTWQRASGMIVSGQITREEALKEYEEPLYDEKIMDEYIAIVKERFHITDAEFDAIMAAPTHQHEEDAVERKSLANHFLRAIVKINRMIN